MRHQFQLEYWIDDGWYVGRLRGIPGVFSQGETLEELEENIREAYDLMRQETDTSFSLGLQVQTKTLELFV